MELLDEVNERDEVIGIRPRDQFFGKMIRRSVDLILFNSLGEMLLQKRHYLKKRYPGLYMNAVGGAVNAGETYEQAILREMKEEIGIFAKVKFLFKFLSETDNKVFHAVFIAKHEGPFTLEENEVESVKWISLAALTEEIKVNPAQFARPFLKIIEIAKNQNLFKQYTILQQ